MTQKLLDVTRRAELMSHVDEMEFDIFDDEEDHCRECGHDTFLHVPEKCKETCVNCGKEHWY